MSLTIRPSSQYWMLRKINESLFLEEYDTATQLNDAYSFLSCDFGEDGISVSQWLACISHDNQELRALVAMEQEESDEVLE